MTLDRYPGVLRRRWRLVAAGLLLGVVVGLGAWWAIPSRYSSETTLYVATRGGDSRPGEVYDATLLSYEQARTYLAFLKGPQAVHVVAAAAGVDPGVVANGVVATAVPETAIITVTATARSPLEARAIARAIEDQFLALSTELGDPAGATAGRITQPATYQVRSVSSGVVRLLGLGVGAGLLLGAVAAVAADVGDRTIRGARRLAAAADAPVLGVVPRGRAVARRPLSLHEEDGSRAEAYRQVRTNLAFVTGRPDRRVLLVAGTGGGEGRSTLVVELAVALSDAGSRVVVVDTDLRTGGTSALLALESTVGLSGVLCDQVALDDAVQPWGHGRFDVVTCGRLPPHPTELLGSPALERTLQRLAATYDVVLLDAPPAASTADACVLAARSDAVVVVARWARTVAEELASTVTRVRAAGAPVVGAVLIGAPSPGPRWAPPGRSRRGTPGTGARVLPGLVPPLGVAAAPDERAPS